MKTILFSLIVMLLVTSCTKERLSAPAAASSQRAEKVVLMKTPYGVIVPSDQYDQWKNYNPKDPKAISPAGPKLNYYGGECTLEDGSPGLWCGTCTSGCNCLNSFPCTYCANC